MNSEGLTQRSRVDGAPWDPTQKKYLEKSYLKASDIVKKPGVPSLIVGVAIPLVLGMIDGIVFSPGPWYLTLKKPWWNPPGPLFGMAWSLLYPIMGLASWLVWADGGLHKQGYPLMLYAIQLMLNLLWPALFFGAHAMGLALVDIILLVIVLAMTVNAFQPVNHVAGHLLKPYLAWVAFAALLNLTLFWKNR